jgi:hypothetical protein
MRDCEDSGLFWSTQAIFYTTRHATYLESNIRQVRPEVAHAPMTVQYRHEEIRQG